MSSDLNAISQCPDFILSPKFHKHSLTHSHELDACWVRGLHDSPERGAAVRGPPRMAVSQVKMEVRLEPRLVWFHSACSLHDVSQEYSHSSKERKVWVRVNFPCYPMHHSPCHPFCHFKAWWLERPYISRLACSFGITHSSRHPWIYIASMWLALGAKPTPPTQPAASLGEAVHTGSSGPLSVWKIWLSSHPRG